MSSDRLGDRLQRAVDFAKWFYRRTWFGRRFKTPWIGGEVFGIMILCFGFGLAVDPRPQPPVTTAVLISGAIIGVVSQTIAVIRLDD